MPFFFATLQHISLYAMKKLFVFLLVAVVSSIYSLADDFVVANGRLELVIGATPKPVMKTALAMFVSDWERVFSTSPTFVSSKTPQSPGAARIVAGVVGDPVLSGFMVNARQLKDHAEAFSINISADGTLIVAGSDAHGVAYGLLEVSRLIGVSPWEWWADSPVPPRRHYRLAQNYHRVESPSVAYRGIFINDEDWGLNPWSWKTNDPQEKGVIGPGTTERIFQLLLRLRANTYWPPMHSCSRPFFLTDGNREMAEKYGIYIGTSHCEPMGCNANGEWRVRGNGEYNFKTNKDSVLSFWRQRVHETASQEMIYTLGMRGIHDSGILGANNKWERRILTEEVIKEQRTLLASELGKPVDQIPQVFIPYKEVLDAYNDDMKVPDDVTLMWCDDNYGYIRHTPNRNEAKRRGGNGLYYHASYWGRPHDYLWLGTFSPALMFQQLSTAYENGIRKIWILNVGDIKPLEYQTELFLDMAWNVENVEKIGVQQHLKEFLAREFGELFSDNLAQALLEHYRLSFICRPEFLGNTRTEEKDPSYKVVSDLPWSKKTVIRRLTQYQNVSDKVEKIAQKLPATLQPSFFQLVGYPVWAAYQMNKKMLSAQMARHGDDVFASADVAYDSIVSMTARYNNAKWNGIMDCHPRQLPVFDKVQQRASTTDWVKSENWKSTIPGSDSKKGKVKVWPSLGYSNSAAQLLPDEQVFYNCETENETDTVEVELHFLPTHPLGDEVNLKVTVSADGKDVKSFDIKTEGRSEEWKQNVLRNQAIQRLKLPAVKGRQHRLCVSTERKGIIIDQILTR